GFVDQARLHIARLITRQGNVEGLLAAEHQAKDRATHFIAASPQKSGPRPEPMELKPLLTAIHLDALHRAKSAENLAVDTLARIAVIKFLRVELYSQFAQVLERCRMMLRNYEGMRHEKALDYRERVAS